MVTSHDTTIRNVYVIIRKLLLSAGITVYDGNAHKNVYDCVG